MEPATPASKPTVVLIDDDHGPMDIFVEVMMAKGFDVRHIDQADDVRSWLESTAQPPSAIVVDIMMPCSDQTSQWLGMHTVQWLTMSEDCEWMMHTGTFVARKIKERFPDIPLIVLTNSLGERRDLPAGIPVLMKYDISPNAFAGILKKRLAGATAEMR